MDYHHYIGKPGRVRLIVLMFICYFSFVALPGCSPKVIEKVVTKTEYVDVHHRDTLITKDSVYIREWMKGDTVFVDKFRDRYVYRDRWRDCISIKEVHDTTTVEKKVERELTAGQRMKINSFWWLIVALGAALVWIFRKPIINLIKTLI